MNIKLRTGGLLGQYLPPGGERNRAQLEVPDGSTPVQVMTLLKLPMQDSYLVSVNGTVLATPESQRDTQLRDGDELALMPPIRGG